MTKFEGQHWAIMPTDDQAPLVLAWTATRVYQCQNINMQLVTFSGSVTADAMVLKHQVISIHIACKILTVLSQFNTKYSIYSGQRQQIKSHNFKSVI